MSIRCTGVCRIGVCEQGRTPSITPSLALRHPNRRAVPETPRRGREESDRPRRDAPGSREPRPAARRSTLPRAGSRRGRADDTMSMSKRHSDLLASSALPTPLRQSFCGPHTANLRWFRRVEAGVLGSPQRRLGEVRTARLQQRLVSDESLWHKNVHVVNKHYHLMGLVPAFNFERTRRTLSPSARWSWL